MAWLNILTRLEVHDNMTLMFTSCL